MILLGILFGILASIAIGVAAAATTLWLQAHWRPILSWLLAPFRAWIGLDETRYLKS